MARKIVPPEILYEYIDDGDTSVLNEAFNYLFDRFFKELEQTIKE